MKPYSITRRVVSLVLVVELIAAIGVTAFAFFYERHSHFRAFDISLRGRADTVMGAVEDADDAKLGVMLDKTDLKMPRKDVYAVREEGGQELGQSPNWSPSSENWEGEAGYFLLKVNGRSYRGIRLRGVRVVDPMVGNVRHSLTVLYASPTKEVWEGVFGAVQVFALANGLLVLLTALLVPLLVRRSMNPLHSLAVEAGGVTATAWQFAPKDDVREVAELRPLVDAMEGVIRRLEKSFTQQRQFVGDAAHELKTAVAVVKSSIQLLELRAKTTLEYESGLKRCYADCLRMEDLAQKMLMMARVEEAGKSEPTERTDLAAAVHAAVAELAPFAALRSVEFVATGEAGANVGIDSAMLRSLLVNLLTNAVQHSPAASEVRVGVACDGATVELLVEDFGEGIAAEVLPFVFDRFYRGDPSRSRKTGGTGLGLAICKTIVERARGSIRIESVRGSGTKVLVTLPVFGQI
ncbi:ATP-binding protein [Granulicella arctica]|uniref:histidine kinase n=1 Tax=Granulicella arctica TaxID=940613 RepID=A0A7Y9TLU5_9BACT|nr:signal transduction histidine kinase [Granulicella arctica]